MLISSMPKGGSLATLCKVSSFAMTSPLAPVVHSDPKRGPPKKDKETVPLTSHGFNRLSSAGSGILKATTPTSLQGKVQYRYVHTDYQCPDYTKYRCKSTNDPNKRAQDSVEGRKIFTYVMSTVATTVVGAVVAKDVINKVCFYLYINQDNMAAGSTEIDLSKVPEGKSVTFKWRGKPIFVKHRTEEEIERERATNLSVLVDPEADEHRVKDPKWLVMIGVCTHLGCIPLPNTGDFPGGYFCPCHGSHYDGSGRIRKGPAPKNLEIPPYVFEGDNKVIIGD